jgi:hypothetical protein
MLPAWSAHAGSNVVVSAVCLHLLLQAQVDRSSMHSFHSCRSHESAATSVTSRSMYSTASYATASLASGFGGSSRRSIGSGVRSKRAGGPAGSSVMSGGSATGRRRQTGVLMEEMMMVEEEEPHSGGLSSGHHLDQGRLQGDGPPGLYPSPGSHDLGVVVGSPTLGGGTGGAAGGGSAGGAPGGPSGVTSWVSAAQAGARKAIPLMVLRWFWGATPAGDGGEALWVVKLSENPNARGVLLHAGLLFTRVPPECCAACSDGLVPFLVTLTLAHSCIHLIISLFTQVPLVSMRASDPVTPLP